jgi:hypothetical protein
MALFFDEFAALLLCICSAALCSLQRSNSFLAALQPIESSVVIFYCCAAFY